MFIIIMCIHYDEQIVYDNMMKFEDKYFCNKSNPSAGSLSLD